MKGTALEWFEAQAVHLWLAKGYGQACIANGMGLHRQLVHRRMKRRTYALKSLEQRVCFRVSNNQAAR